ncbi:uncharacterized protein N7459_001106 [Penicillium hispanicum]|uniref:uncharacterized protein n=1 Tax=Penicillium hispanicum TaxID=1080232 RepID=UPI00254055B2|nr:uncharacterized protein N7459_001106 [Penicillium hispanicum]KAJ5594898.1 hypothetical protein N7459_001106 [Penicillium hispanicum]
MSRNLLPAVLAIGVGVFTGYYTFQPAFQDLAIERAHGRQPPSIPSQTTPQKSADTSANEPSTTSAPSAKPETERSK